MSIIWIPHQTEAWVTATVIATESSGNITVKPKNGAETSIPGPLSKYDTVSPGSLEQNVENLVDLENFNEGIILHHIRKRFMSSNIYTSVGNILVAVNPYKSLNIYGVQVMEEIFNAVKKKQQQPLPPHVYSIAAQALYNMNEDHKDQCVLISGESGAGKTEATKKILQFISTMSKSSTSRTGVSIESQILDSNPILESFGNAKTIRNNNSSRFGKYMEINFDAKRNIKGCNIVAYLLEKSRVVTLSQFERNYHVFYMLLAGANRELRQELHLRPADQFRYLNMGDCLEVDNRNDTLEFLSLLKAMEDLGFQADLQKTLFQCLAAILHLGNLDFSPSKHDEGGSQVSSTSDCKKIATLLGFPSPELLDKSLCFRENTVGNETFVIPVEPKKAADQRDALSKYVYGKIFEVIVSQVNQSLFRGKHALNIGVLDIFGFEVFKENSFEQLCINYCNERLQTFFNEVIFEEEMKMYAADGISCEDIAYQDNLGCVRLIDLKGSGIFALLDEEIMLPKGSEDKFIQKLHQTFDETAATKSKYYGRNRKNPKEFIVRHFAGDVVYNSVNFMEKNRDALAPGLVKLVQQSTLSFLKESTSDTSASSNQSGGGGNGRKSSTKMTLAAKFKLDLDSLMTTLRSTNPHFIRCVKPNELQQCDRFDAALTLNQLKYSGLFEAIRIRKAGYAIRIPHLQFIERYKHCATQKFSAEVKADPAVYCQRLLTNISPLIDQALAGAASKGRRTSVSRKMSTSGSNNNNNNNNNNSTTTTNNNNTQSTPDNSAVMWCIGNQRVYLRHTQYKFHLDQLRLQAVTNVAPEIQRIVRGFLGRRRVMKLRGLSAAQMESARRLLSQERDLMTMNDEESRSVEDIIKNDQELQSRIAEAKKARIRAEQQRKAAILNNAATGIQRRVRGYLTHRRVKLMLCEHNLRDAVESRDYCKLRKAMSMITRIGIYAFAKHKLIKRVRNEYVLCPPNATTMAMARMMSGFHALLHCVDSLNTIRGYELRAKTMVAELLNQSYVANELREACVCENIQVLRDSIRMAKTMNMTHLTEFRDAVDSLKSAMESRMILKELSEHLQHCNSVPALLSRCDSLQRIVQSCIRLGLGGEPMVLQTVNRISNLKLLISTRDHIRYAVEIVSISRMNKALKERQKFVSIYGESLMCEEVTAVQSMKRLMHFEQMVSCLDSGHRDSPDGDSETKSSKNTSEDSDDVRLPPFVRDTLDKLKYAKNSQEFNSAVRRFLVLVPTDSRRKEFMRCFKWVVAVAYWKYSREDSDKALSSLSSLSSSSSSLDQLTCLLEDSSVLLSVSMDPNTVLSPVSGKAVPDHPLAQPDNNTNNNNNNNTNSISNGNNGKTAQQVSVGTPGKTMMMTTTTMTMMSPQKGSLSRFGPGISFADPMKKYTNNNNNSISNTSKKTATTK